MENTNEATEQKSTKKLFKTPSEYELDLMELANLVRKKADKSEKLANLEREIYFCESAYLQTTQDFGNMIRGWDKHRILGRKTFLKSNQIQNKFLENERIFSKSSVTSILLSNQNNVTSN